MNLKNEVDAKLDIKEKYEETKEKLYLAEVKQISDFS